MAKKKHLSQYDSAGNRQEIYLNDDEVMTGGKTLGDRLDEMQEDIRDAAEQGGIQQESDPTVPSWAKQPEKPTYTPQEVGAVPSQGYVEYTQAEKEKLRDLPNASELSTRLGEKANAADVYDKQTVDDKVANAGKVKSVSVNGGNPQLPNEQTGNVDLIVEAGGASVVINSDGANIVDSHTNPSILVAPSARQMVMAANNIDTLFRKVNDLFDKLAGIAFSDDKPANWKEVANWSTPAIPTHTITLGAMTNVGASMNGAAISGSTTATEGEVTILLTPSNNNYMGSISVKDANNNDVTFTQTDAAGGTEITFIISGNVIISASASSGIQVNVSGTGISSYTTGVPPSTAAQLTIALPEHHTWGTISVSYGGVDITSQCTISSSNNADKVITLPDNLSDMSKVISIVANTIEDIHVTLALSGTNFVVKQGSTQLQNGSKVYNGSAAQTLSIEPASGCKFSTLPSADKGTMTNNGYYEASSLVIGTSLSGTLTISAQGTALSSCNVVLPSDANITASLTDLNGNALTTPVTEGSAVRITLAPIGDVNISISSATMVGTGNLTFSDNNGAKSVEIAHVTGNIVITAVAEQVVTYNVTKKLLNMASSAADDTTDADFGYKHNSVVDGENYTDTIAPVSGAAYNNDLKVYVGGTLLTADTDYTYTNNVLTIPAAKVTGDITIMATAATGTITVRSNTSGTTATVGGTTITCDTADGNEFVGTASGITAFNALSFSDKTKITSLDFGGAKYTASLFTNNAGLFQGMTALTSLAGLVISGTKTLRQAFNGCTALAVLQTIGWDTSNVGTDYALYHIFTNCSSLTKIDLEYFIRSGAGGTIQECFKGCSNLSEIRGLETWITNGITSLYETFRDCPKLNNLDFHNWNTSNCTSIQNTFTGSTKTIRIGAGFDTSRVNIGVDGYVAGPNGLVIEIHSETPPAVNTSNVWFGRVYNWQSNLTIKVPAAALDTYKETEGYSTYQSVITTL